MFGHRSLLFAINIVILVVCNAQPLETRQSWTEITARSLHRRQNSEASLAASCTTLKKKTAGAAWNLYYAGSGFIRSDSYVIAQVPASGTAGLEPENVCSVANDINRSCSQFATSLGLKQMALVWTQPPVNSTAPDPDGPWTCLLLSADNPSPGLFNTPANWADHVWAWTQT